MYGSISPTILVDQGTRNRSQKIVKHGLRPNTALGCRFLCPEFPFCGKTSARLLRFTSVYWHA